MTDIELTNSAETEMQHVSAVNNVDWLIQLIVRAARATVESVRDDLS
jgi:hypothetical protein